MADREVARSNNTMLSDKVVTQSVSATSSYWTGFSTFLPDRKDPYLRLHSVMIYVRDQERSLRFYRDQLGFSVVSDARFESGMRWIEVAPPDGTATLALVAPIPGSEDERLIGLGGLVNFLTEDVEAKFHEWSERGVYFSLPPQAPAWGGVFCRFEDVDGNAFVLTGFDEVSREIDTRRRAVAEHLEAERRAEQELEIAKQVQARLFPQSLPPVTTLDYAGVCIQARAVGGDYYDFLDLGRERVALVIGDIAGKGIAAALLMANLQANLRSQCAIALDRPEQYLDSVNRLLFESTTSSAYATLFFAEYDNRYRKLRYANCGHLPALVLHSDGTLDRLPATCTVVGLFEDWQSSFADCPLKVGDVLALYTDGVTESFNDSGEEFGEDRLIEALRRDCKLTSGELAGAIVAEVQGFSSREQYDDITLIIAKCV